MFEHVSEWSMKVLPLEVTGSVNRSVLVCKFIQKVSLRSELWFKRGDLKSAIEKIESPEVLSLITVYKRFVPVRE